MSGLPARQRLQIARILWMTYPSLISLSRLGRDCHHVWRVCVFVASLREEAGAECEGNRERLDALGSAHKWTRGGNLASSPQHVVSPFLRPSVRPFLSHQRRRCIAHFMQKRLFWVIIKPEFMTSLRVGGKFCTLGLEVEQSRVFRFPRGKFAYGRKRAFSFLWCMRRP